MSSKSAEFKKLVFFQAFSKADVVEVVEAVDRITECVVIFFLNQEVVVCIIDSFNIEL